ncbi:amine oxidase (flavin-containing) [Ophiocordyceps sinensis CO18]|uniref:Amine oxidase (Flavin-containing) n=1 Tax=Ophiocordyceps sinensis (strain Co18 / CGMCC 3.14243) TaxID=911162 RepID=T5AM21_OPHSC|nr:amine oxidase (flavin-containing) [Ophiocordyceps sinensis CO18]
MRFCKLVSCALSALVLPCTALTRPSAGHTRDLFLRQILAKSPSYGGFCNCSSGSGEKLKVGIIGAGPAGLYAAVLLDSLGIDYDILESNQRIGGRIFTHRFDQEAWDASKPGEPDYYDYYDVGAMRFPGMEWMDRIIGKANNSLVPYINSKLKPEDQIKLIPYIFQANDTFRLFNDKLIYNQASPSAENFNVLVADGGTINNDTFAAMSPSAVLGGAIRNLVQALVTDFDTGFNMLMQYDAISVRQYMLQKGYSPQQIDWIETIADATTHYDTYSLSEAVMEQWIFYEAPLSSWKCVEGGMGRIVDGLVKIISKTVETTKRVTAIKPADSGALKVVINGDEERTYHHVINTAPLGAMQVMDMTELDLDYRKKLAIRRLQYDPAGKIGMKFKSRWWESLDSGSFQGGQSFSDLPIRRCVYPSYGLDTPDAAGTMIASYTWGQDSARLGAYYTHDDARKRIIEITLRNLAAMHNVTYEFLESQYVDSHLWNWYEGQDTVGAFAIFGPSEYSSMLPALMMPAAEGKLHFAGEALSSGHAWIIGAVNSAYRTVAEILAVERMDHKLAEMVDTWGLVNEVDMGWYSNVFVQ